MEGTFTVHYYEYRSVSGYNRALKARSIRPRIIIRRADSRQRDFTARALSLANKHRHLDTPAFNNNDERNTSQHYLSIFFAPLSCSLGALTRCTPTGRYN